jgi:hypothetical protein
MLRIYRSSGVVIKFVVVANRYSVWELLHAGANIIRSNQWLIQLDNSTSIVRRLQYSSLLLMRRCSINLSSSVFASLTFADESLRVPTILDVVV